VEALRAVVKGELRGDGWVTGVTSPAARVTGCERPPDRQRAL
jgi:hypothetical protein